MYMGFYCLCALTASFILGACVTFSPLMLDIFDTMHFMIYDCFLRNNNPFVDGGDYICLYCFNIVLLFIYLIIHDALPNGNL